MSRNSRRKKKFKKKQKNLTNLAISSLPGSLAQNRKKTCKDKLNSYKNSILRTTSSPTSPAVLTFNDQGYRSYYNGHTRDWSRKLYLPTATDCADLLTNCSNSFSDSTRRDFWFTLKTHDIQFPIQTTNPMNDLLENSPKISALQYSLAECKEDESPLTENYEADPELQSENPENKYLTYKIRFYPNFQQKRMLKMFIGSCRKVYNIVTDDYRQTRKLKLHAYYRDLIKQRSETDCPYLIDVPYNSKDEAIREAMSNIRTTITLYRNTGRYQSPPVRDKKKNQQVLPIREKNINEMLKIYPRILFSKRMMESNPSKWDKSNFTKNEQNLNFKARTSNNQSKWLQKFRKSTNYDPSLRVRDSKVIWNKKVNEWFLCLVVIVEDRDDQAVHKSNRTVSCDPGNKTFITWYSPEKGIGKIGENDGQKLIKICLQIDSLISKKTRVNAYQRQKLSKVIWRLKKRLINLRSDFHRKTASWLTKNFDVVIIPIFNTHLMARRRNRKINSKTVRGLLTWAHGMFRKILLGLCERRGKVMLNPSEAYTSKTCSNCGWIDEKLGGKPIFHCKNEGIKIDRDINGARGIFLRALLGGSLSLENADYEN